MRSRPHPALRLVPSLLLAACAPWPGAPDAQVAQRADPIVVPSPVPVCRVDADETGMLDATSAFEDALACATMGLHAQVFVPQGTYALSARLDVPADVALVGEPAVSLAPLATPSGSPYDTVPELRFPAGFADDAIALGDRASVAGLHIAFAGPQAAGKAAVTVTGVGASVQSLRITNASIGVHSPPAVNSGRIYVNGIYVEESTVGLDVDFGLDVSRFENVHVERATVTPGTVGIVFGRNDYMLASRLSVARMAVGVEFRDTSNSAGGSSIASLTTVQTTGCTDGLYVHGGARVSATGVSIAADTHALRVGDTATLSLSGARLEATRGSVVTVESPGASLTMTGSTVAITGSSGEHGVQVAGARLLTLVGNAISSGGYGVYFTASASRGVIAGNTFDLSNPSGRAVIGSFDATAVAVSGNSSNR